VEIESWYGICRGRRLRCPQTHSTVSKLLKVKVQVQDWLVDLNLESQAQWNVNWLLPCGIGSGGL